MTTPPPQDEVRYALTFSPERYDETLDPSAEGRWIYISDLGTLWTDDHNRLGLISSDAGESTDNSILLQMISEYKSLNASATQTFNALATVYNATGAQSGKLEQAETAQPPAPAAPAAPTSPAEEGIATEPEVFAAFRNNDEFVGVGMAAPNGMYVRADGGWALLPDTDLRFDDTEWLPLDTAGVAKYDEAENSGTTLARADVESQAPRT